MTSATTEPSRVLAVDVDIAGTTLRAGTASFSSRRGPLLTDFRYERDFVRRGYDLDPTLDRADVVNVVEGMPGSFADSTPDWWGRTLISRQERVRARESGEPPRLLTDVDFLLGVDDATRQGALRFRLVDGSGHLAEGSRVPTTIALPDLLAASDDVVTDPDDAHVHQALKTLLAAGSGTLGGARPKASVYVDADLYIAKFPNPVDDRWDVAAWEKTAADLAGRLDIDVPARRLERVGHRSVLLSRRFDRTEPIDGAQARIGYISASTILGGPRSQSWDYLDLAAAIEDHSAAVDADLADLWRRIAFSIAVHNTDDHLRNHGFLRTSAGWRLSPLFDVNPDPEVARPRSTAIGGEVIRERDAEALQATAAYFGLSDAHARHLFDEIVSQVRGDWRTVALGNGIAASEVDRFAPIFDA